MDQNIDNPLVQCLRALAVTVRERQIGSAALAMLPLEQLPDDAPVPEPLLLLLNANMKPEATAELLERAALRHAGQPVAPVEGAPEAMVARLDAAAELVAQHVGKLLDPESQSEGKKNADSPGASPSFEDNAS